MPGANSPESEQCAGTSNACREGMLATKLIALLALGLIASCSDDERAQTSVRLTIDYPQAAPVWLKINGTAADGQHYGPNLLPDPPRPLAPARETVLLELPDAMDGQVLVLIVSGLDEQRMLQMRGTVRTEVVRHTMQSAFVSLQLGIGCASDRSSSVYCTGDEDAGTPQVPEPGALEPADPIDAGTMLEPDAALPEPDAAAPEPEEPEEPPQEPEEPPQEPEEPEDSIRVLRCEEGPACDLKCPGDAHCAIDCGGAKDCKPTCKNAICEIDCSGSERCQPTCEGRSVCEITCGDASCEDVRCRGEAECIVHCSGDDCELDDD
jgi:hypothetical protein